LVAVGVELRVAVGDQVTGGDLDLTIDRTSERSPDRRAF
jgi:hypothetical protein